MTDRSTTGPHRRLADVRRSLPRGLTRAALVTISLLVGCLLAEVGASIWLHWIASDEQFRHYATLDQNRRRSRETGESLTVVEPHRYLGYVPAAEYRRGMNHHNSLGYRGEEIPRKRTPHEFRIAALGGSTTYTSHVEDPKDAYPAVLQELLRRRWHPEVRVINAGVPGWSSYETLINFELRVLDLDPDMILVYSGINDALARLVWPARYYRGDNSGRAIADGRWFREPPLQQRSNAARMLLIRTGRLMPVNSLLATFLSAPWHSRFLHYCAQVAQGTYPSGVFAEVPAEQMLETNAPIYFRRNLQNLVALAQHHEIAPVLATFGLGDGFGDSCLATPLLRRAIEQQNQVIRDVASDLGAVLFDYAAVAPSDPSLYYDPVHLLADGARVKAELFADFLIARGLPPAPENRAEPRWASGGLNRDGA